MMLAFGVYLLGGCQCRPVKNTKVAAMNVFLYKLICKSYWVLMLIVKYGVERFYLIHILE